MSSLDPTAAAAWSRVLDRLDGADETAAPTSTAAPAGEALPAWWVAIAAVPTVGSAAPPPPIVTAPASTATTAPLPPAAPKPSAIDEAEPIGAWVWRRWAEPRGRGG